MNLFAAIHGKKKAAGQYSGTFTAKWASLSCINTPGESYEEDDAVDFYSKTPSLAKLLKSNFSDLTIEWNSDCEFLSNVNIDSFDTGEVSTKDKPSIKWVQANFSFDTDLDINDSKDDIEDALRFGFSPEVEASHKSGYVVFKFSDFEDPSVELN